MSVCQPTRTTESLTQHTLTEHYPAQRLTYGRLEMSDRPTISQTASQPISQKRQTSKSRRLLLHTSLSVRRAAALLGRRRVGLRGAEQRIVVRLRRSEQPAQAASQRGQHVHGRVLHLVAAAPHHLAHFFEAGGHAQRLVDPV
eukprot:Selendium_serpulae@DN1480_c0_g1_i1.p1